MGAEEMTQTSSEAVAEIRASVWASGQTAANNIVISGAIASGQNRSSLPLRRSACTNIVELFSPEIDWEGGQAKSSPTTDPSRCWQKWFSKLDKFCDLELGWDGDNAHAPNQRACNSARSFLESLQQDSYEPERIAPSVVGGVGLTFRKHPHKVYVEFKNGGKVHALFSDGVFAPRVEEVTPDRVGYQVLIRRMRDYLHD
jgi:hypothetical protein